MRALFCIACLSFLSLVAPRMLHAQDEEKNVVIESQTQEFSFEKSRSAIPVEIHEKYTQRFRCNDVRTSIVFSEMYNDNESIDDVDIRVEGKKAKGITPKFDYYSVQDIFYSDARVCYFELPLEKKGGVSEVSLAKTYKDPRYFTTVYFTESYFVENKTVKFIIPRWMKAEIHEYNIDNRQISKSSSYDSKADADIITYTIHDLPAFRREPAAPGGSYIYPHLLVLCQEADIDGKKTVFFKTLTDQYKWYHQLVMELHDDKPALEKKAREISAGANSDLARIKAVYNWVQHNIRYIAYEDGIAGFKPAPAIDVLNKKYGDCKGMANLTRGLLASLGYDARLCWIGTNHIAYDYSTPSMAVDNHMICALFYKGKTYFLDATETNIGFDEYAERIQGRQVLIEDGDKYLLEHVPAASPEQNTEREVASLHFNGTEDLQGKVKISLRGESRSDLLNKIESIKKEKMSTALSDYLADDNQNYQISELNSNQLLGTDSVLNIQYEVLHKKAASSFGDEIYLEADFRKELEGFKIDTAKRHFDIMLPYRMNLETETAIAIPPGYTVSQLPAGKEWTHPNIHIKISYTRKDSNIIYKKQLQIPTILLNKKSFGEWNRIMKELTDQYHEQIIFKKQS